MKTYYGTQIYRGIQYDVMLCCKSIKEAALLLETTPYHIRTYFSIMQTMSPTDDQFIKEPNKVFARFISGILGAVYPTDRYTVMSEAEIKKRINYVRDNPEIAKKFGY